MLRTLLTTVAALPILMGCAMFAQAQDIGERSPQERGLIDATCTNVMGLHRGEAYFADCRDSLAHSLARKDAAYAMAGADKSCDRQGLKPGTSAFATCMLDYKGGDTAQPPTLQPAAFDQSVVQAGKSYYSVTPSVQWQRKRYACAQLGLTPERGLFGECVTSLEGALLSDSN